MGAVSVTQAAERLGVSVPRIHQRIADGSLVAERIGSQWVVDERSLLHIQERSKAGRPHSARSAWAVIAASGDDRDRVGVSGPAVSARARMQLKRLLAPAAVPVVDEEVVRQLVVSLRSVFRNRAQRRLLRAAPADLVDLRPMTVGPCSSTWGRAASPRPTSRDTSANRTWMGREDYLLVEADRDANVVLHVLPDAQYPYPDSRLRLAADLAEHRGPREEARAAELLHELAIEWKAGER